MHGCSFYTSDNRIKYALVTQMTPTGQETSRCSCVPLVANYALVTQCCVILGSRWAVYHCSCRHLCLCRKEEEEN